MERSKLYQQRVEGGLSQEEAARVMEQLDVRAKLTLSLFLSLTKILSLHLHS
jgi:hypothetical protein